MPAPKGKGQPKAKKSKAASDGLAPAVIAEKPIDYTFGRPTSFKPQYVEQAKRLASVGFTDLEMADFFGVCEKTLYNWMSAHDDFLQAVRLGKDAPDDRTERSLYHRANGFEFIEEQVVKLRDETWINGNKEVTERFEVVKVRRRVPPDSTAAIFWLKNRRKEDWRDRQEVTGADGNAIAHTHDVTFRVVDPAHA